MAEIVRTAFIMRREKPMVTEEHTAITMGIIIIHQNGRDVCHMKEDKPKHLLFGLKKQITNLYGRSSNCERRYRG